jgi:hypothetical protein
MRGAILLVLLLLVVGLHARAQGICAGGASPVNPLSTAALSAPGGGGIGGTGAVAGQTGPGGPGIDPGGIGGTGILGVITGFASICVNGVEVHFDDTTPVSDAGEAVPARLLAVGQLVAVQARGLGAEVSASRIALIHAAVGPLSAVDAASGVFHVLGQTGRALSASELEGLRVGDWVRVSGQRLALGDIVASRVERIAPQPAAHLNGVVARIDGNVVMVGGAQVHVGNALMAAGLVPGREITVAGPWDGRTLHAQRLLAEPTRQGIGRAGRVVLEGFVHAAGARQLDLGLGAWELSPDAQLPGGGMARLVRDQRVLVTGSVDANQQIMVDRVQLREGGGDSARGSSSGARRSGNGASGSAAKSGPDDVSGSSERSGSSGGTGSSGSSSGSGKSGESDRSDGSNSGSSGSSGSSGGSGGSGGSGRGK